MEIDELNYAILRIVEETESSLWKNSIYQQLSDRVEEFPGVNSVSVQTVGRRVDWLRDEGYLESCIISPDDIKRDLIIAFKLTADGEAAIRTKQEEFLQRTVRENVFSSDGSRVIGKNGLIEVISSYFGLDPVTQNQLLEQYTVEELETFLTLYYVRQKMRDTFTAEDADRFNDLLQENDHIADTLNRNFFADHENRLEQ